MNPKCRVILQLDDPNAPVKQESLWAQARAAGRYALLNSSFFMPLAVGDIVEATSHGQRLTVVGLDQAGVMTSSLVAVDASVLDGHGHPEPQLLDPLARLGGNAWSTLGEVLRVDRIRLADWNSGKR